MSRAPPRLETNRTSPSTVQAGAVLRWVSPEIRTGSPPSARITQIEDGAMFPMSVPLRNPPFPFVNAMYFPSWDQAGANAPAPPTSVRSRRSSPLRPTDTSPLPPDLLQTNRSADGERAHCVNPLSAATGDADPPSAGT